MKQLIGDWNLEYTKRWQPDVVCAMLLKTRQERLTGGWEGTGLAVAGAWCRKVDRARYTTDDNVVQYYSNPCFQQVEGGPAPICTTAGTQVVSTGINRDPHVPRKCGAH